MRFQLLDSILEVTPGRRLLAVKNLTLAEEYLADHFPGFPVLPGVLMLEAMVQAGAWLIRLSEDFQHSVTLLREVRGLRYGNFVEPGRQLKLEVEVQAQDERTTSFKGKGEVNGQGMLMGRFVVERYNLRDRDPRLAGLDQQLVDHYRSQYLLLSQPRPQEVASGTA